MGEGFDKGCARKQTLRRAYLAYVFSKTRHGNKGGGLAAQRAERLKAQCCMESAKSSALWFPHAAASCSVSRPISSQLNHLLLPACLVPRKGFLVKSVGGPGAAAALSPFGHSEEVVMIIRIAPCEEGSQSPGLCYPAHHSFLRPGRKDRHWRQHKQTQGRRHHRHGCAHAKHHAPRTGTRPLGLGSRPHSPATRALGPPGRASYLFVAASRLLARQKPRRSLWTWTWTCHGAASTQRAWHAAPAPSRASFSARVHA